MKASGAPSKGDLVTAKPQSDNILGWGLTIMGLVVGEIGTRVDIKVFKHSFNPDKPPHELYTSPGRRAAQVHIMEHQTIVQVEKAECKIVNSTSSA